MSKKSAKSERNSRAQKKQQKDWPAVVYLWAIGLGFLGYLIAEAAFRTSQPHPIHWLAALAGGLVGIPVGWLWYRWRGDVI